MWYHEALQGKRIMAFKPDKMIWVIVVNWRHGRTGLHGAYETEEQAVTQAAKFKKEFGDRGHVDVMPANLHLIN